MENQDCLSATELCSQPEIKSNSRKGKGQFAALLFCSSSGVFLHSLYSSNVIARHIEGAVQQCYISTGTREGIMISPLSASLHFLWVFVDVTQSGIICSSAARSLLLIRIMYRLCFLFSPLNV